MENQCFGRVSNHVSHYTLRLSKLPAAKFRSGPGGWGVLQRKSSFDGGFFGCVQVLCEIGCQKFILEEIWCHKNVKLHKSNKYAKILRLPAGVLRDWAPKIIFWSKMVPPKSEMETKCGPTAGKVTPEGSKRSQNEPKRMQKDAKRKPIGAKRVPSGAQRVPKGSQRVTKMWFYENMRFTK